MILTSNGPVRWTIGHTGRVCSAFGGARPRTRRAIPTRHELSDRPPSAAVSQLRVRTSREPRTGNAAASSMHLIGPVHEARASPHPGPTAGRRSAAHASEEAFVQERHPSLPLSAHLVWPNPRLTRPNWANTRVASFRGIPSVPVPAPGGACRARMPAVDELCFPLIW